VLPGGASSACATTKACSQLDAVDEEDEIIKQQGARLLAAVGDVAAEGNTYLIAGAVAVALVGTALPILFSRKDT
jgi:hypothetical protein